MYLDTAGFLKTKHVPQLAKPNLSLVVQLLKQFLNLKQTL
jgi:hypothetical protein